MTPLGRFIVYIASLLLIPLCWQIAARAHDDAHWIGEGPYVGKDGVHCCGTVDCDVIEPESVKETASTYEIVFRGTVYVIQKGDHYGSIDHRIFMCGKGPEGPFRDGCAFIPRGST